MPVLKRKTVTNYQHDLLTTLLKREIDSLRPDSDAAAAIPESLRLMAADQVSDLLDYVKGAE